MERNYDEVISELLIQLDDIERRWEKLDSRLEKADKRLDLSIKRLVKAENRTELFDKKLEQSIKDQRAINKQFLALIDRLIKKNNLKT